MHARIAREGVCRTVVKGAALPLAGSFAACWIGMERHGVPFSIYDAILFFALGVISSYAILLVLLGSVGAIVEWALERRRTVIIERRKGEEERVLSAFRPSPFQER